MKKKKHIKPRNIIQLLFFIIVLLISINHGYEKDTGKALIGFLSTASLHAFCPFGAVETAYTMFFESTILKEIRSSAFILFGIVLFLSVLFGPVFCGWICPFGSVQELISKAGKKLFKNKFNNFINPKLDSVLRYTRYLVLIYILYITAKSGYLIFKDFDPYSTLFGFWREFSIGGLVILAIVILMSFIMERPWCKYLCPYGAMLGITNTFRIFKIQRNPTACISCNACNKSCPMNIDIEKNINVKNHQCITCLDCTSENACPKDSTLELSSSKYKEEVYNDEN